MSFLGGFLKMVCSKCGNQNAQGYAFCTGCGSSLSPQPFQGNQVQPYQPATPVAPAVSAKIPSYVVLQVTLKEKFFGTGSGNLSSLESVINSQAAKGYRLHTITTASANSTGIGGGDRIQATMVFEKI
jgi:hypothetical protein